MRATLILGYILTMYKLTVFIPKEAKESVKSAMFLAGAGRLGNYDCCCFELEGIGQFRPLQGSNPAVGSTDQLEFVPEVRVEMVVTSEHIKAVVSAMKLAHPYETPAYDVIKLEEF